MAHFARRTIELTSARSPHIAAAPPLPVLYHLGGTVPASSSRVPAARGIPVTSERLAHGPSPCRTVNILLQTVMDAAVSAIAFYLLG